jgi:hypothetical protein
MWQEHLGVSVDLVKQEWKIYLSSMKEKNYHLCRSSWVGDYNDPGTFLEMFLSTSGNNRTGWASPKYDEFIAAAAVNPISTSAAHFPAGGETSRHRRGRHPPDLPLRRRPVLSRRPPHRRAAEHDRRSSLPLHAVEKVAPLGT